MQRKSMGHSRLPSGAAFHSFFDNANARGQGSGGALIADGTLIGGTENRDQRATGMLLVLEHSRDGHGTLPGGSRPVPN